MRRIFIISAIVVMACISVASIWWPPIWWSLLIVGPLILMGVFDIIQTKHAIRHNFPLIGRLRYILEGIRPEIQQYFVESDTTGRPFSRMFRAVIYQRAKKVLDTTPFGTQLDVYGNNYEWLSHSIAAIDYFKINEHPRVTVGGPYCKQPYSSSVFNISAMSYGSLSKNAIMALNGGAQMGGFFHNTGEGGITEYHLGGGGDIVWQIGTGYFGCRTPDGGFNPEAFAEKSQFEQVKMIEIKLSQGAKPGHGGILPAVKVTPEVARIRSVEVGKEVDSPPFHRAFSTPIGLLQFVKQLRELSNGKPIGFKLCIGHRSEFIAICKAMIETGIYPDFITVDGGEGGTGAAPLEFSNSVGMPLREALAFVYDCLTGFGLKQHIKIIAAGKIATGFDLVKYFALGADICNSARGMMMALGCIQALQCHANTCPAGVATQDPALSKGLDVTDKRFRVANFHRETVKAAGELMGAAGIKHPDDIHRVYIHRRVAPNRVETYLDSYPYIPWASLLQEPYPKSFELLMRISRSDSFQPDFSEIDFMKYAWAKKPMTG